MSTRIQVSGLACATMSGDIAMMRYLVPYFGDQWGKFVEISAWKIQHPTESDENIKISEELDGNRQRWLNWYETVHFFWNQKTRDEITRYVKRILSLWKAVVPVRSTQKLPWMQLFHRWWTLMCSSPACWHVLLISLLKIQISVHQFTIAHAFSKQFVVCTKTCCNDPQKRQVKSMQVSIWLQALFKLHKPNLFQSLTRRLQHSRVLHLAVTGKSHLLSLTSTRNFQNTGSSIVLSVLSEKLAVICCPIFFTIARCSRWRCGMALESVRVLQEIYPSPCWIVLDNKTFPSNEIDGFYIILHIFSKNFHKQGTQKWSLPVMTVWYLNSTIPPRISPFTNTSLLILHQHPIPLISPQQLFNSFILTSDSFPSLSNYGITGPLLELLQFRADPNIFGPFGASPLGFATSAKTVQLLLRFRAQAGLTGRNSPKKLT